MRLRSSLLFLPLVSVSLLLAACGEETTTAEAPTKAPAAVDETIILLTPEQQATMGIKTAVVTRHPVPNTVTATATITVNRNLMAQVTPTISSKVSKILVDQGEKVEANQPLALLDSADLGEARSALAQSLSELDVAQAAAARAEKLSREDIISEKDLLRARSDLKKAQASATAVRNRLYLLGGEGGQGATYPIVAPFAGTVIDRMAVLGELAPMDRPLFTIADLSVLWAEADLYEKELGKVDLGANAEVTVAAYPDRIFPGKLAYISNIMDPATRTVKARIEVPDPEGLLKPNMFAKVRISSGNSTTEMITVPPGAVVMVDNQPVVYVHENEGFHPHVVDVAESTPTELFIRDGLIPGQPVVISGAYTLKALSQKSKLSDG